MSLAEGPTGQSYPKLPLSDTISTSYSTYFHNFVDVLRASWLWLAPAAALMFFASWQQWSWMANVMANASRGLALQLPPRPFEMTILGNIANLFVLFAGVSIAVAWHRLVILGEHPGFCGSNVMTKNLWRYIGIGIAVCLIVILPAAVILFPIYFVFLSQTAGVSPSAGSFMLVPVIMVFYAVGIAVVLRLSLLLPAQAVGDLGLTFKQTWNCTRGNTWCIFWGLVACTVPAGIVAQVVFLIGIGVPNLATFADENFVTQMTFFSATSVVYYLLILPISIGFLSHAYRHFFRATIAPDR
jgi:hypothetical protein